MAARSVAEKRGPKIGDAASLWNFTPSPGWTKEEAQVLKLCLMKLGIGRWMQILEMGLLPGKLIQQLNGQTQRLLGQQSLAAYTGLQVDIDRIRADNETRTDAPRKAGLIINTGANVTKEVKEKMQEEARAKYGLTAEQIKEVEEQLEELAANANAASEDASLLTADPSGLSKEKKIAMLRTLHARLVQLQAALTRQLARQGSAAQASGSDQENSNQAANARAPGVAAGKRKAPGSSAAGGRRNNSSKNSKGVPRGGGGGRRTSKQQQQFLAVEDSDEEMAEAEAAAAAVAAAAVDQADVAALVGMGFGERQAKEALEETNGNVEMAVEWLMVHCV